MDWLFRRMSKAEKERDVTQRSQFDTDDARIEATLVRESHQNSLDARPSGSAGLVRTRITRVTPPEGNEDYFGELFAGLAPHLTASGIDLTGIDFAKPTFLVIEDFGTTGLIGKWDDFDDMPFSDFWRREGRSHKGGTSNGRWGLGKLVFSAASRIRTFFGLTIRFDDPSQPLLMGEAVLKTHSHDGQKFDPYGSYARAGADEIRLPETSSEAIEKFRVASGITRTHEPGFSVAIPFPIEALQAQSLVEAVLRNYFFPILTGQLEVEVEGELINNDTFDVVAAKLKSNPLSPDLISFIRSIDAKLKTTPDVVLASQWTDDMERGLDADTLKALRDRFTAPGSLIHVRAPIVLREKNNTSRDTYFDLFLMKANDGISGESLYVRSAITVPNESRYFAASNVFGALLAKDDAVAEFLGDAENPAHTQWNGSAEKLRENWKNGSGRLREIRSSLRALYKAIAQMEEYTENDALIDFFSVDDLEAGRKMPKKAAVKPPMPPIPVSKKTYTIASRKGGFAIRPGAGLTQEALPLIVKVRVAYDLLNGNPLKKFDPLDFHINQAPITIIPRGAICTSTGPNALEVEITDLDFSVEVKGFDENRDLLVDARKEGR